MEKEDIKVMFVAGGDQALAAKLRQGMEESDGITLAGEFAGGEEVTAMAVALADVIVVAGDAGIDTARRLAEAGSRARVVLVTDSVIRDLASAAKAGVAGLLPANVTLADLIETIRRVQLWAPHSVALV